MRTYTLKIRRRSLASVKVNCDKIVVKNITCMNPKNEPLPRWVIRRDALKEDGENQVKTQEKDDVENGI